MYVCLCNGVTEQQIADAVSDGASSVEEVMACTRAGTRCGSCIGSISAIVADSEGGAPAKSCRRLTVVPHRVSTAA